MYIYIYIYGGFSIAMFDYRWLIVYMTYLTIDLDKVGVEYLSYK
jgi:hypothetical protein